MCWGSTCLQVCSSGPQHQIMQTNNRTPFLGPEDADCLVSAKEAELQLFNSGHIHSTPHSQMVICPKKHNSKQLGESQRVKKEGLHAGEYGCRVLCL